jgi:hypothetical protein
VGESEAEPDRNVWYVQYQMEMEIAASRVLRVATHIKESGDLDVESAFAVADRGKEPGKRACGKPSVIIDKF